MKDKIIKTITIQIAGVEVEVTPQQAKDLHGALGDLLGLDKPKQIIERETVRDRRYPYWPYITKTYTYGSAGGTVQPNFDKYVVTYNTDNANARLTIR
jgi:hypothetical protein